MRDQQFARLVEKVEPTSKLLRFWKLTGGVSATVTALEVKRSDGGTKRLVVREHGETDRKRNPNIAADEFRLLQMLQSAGLPVPAAYFFDQSGEILPTPYIVVEYIEGQTDSVPASESEVIRQLADVLLRLHRMDCARRDVSFLPRLADSYGKKFQLRPAELDESMDEGRIRDALEAVWPLSQNNQDVILHGDFWPGNAMWRNGRLAAVIDWEDAGVGDPLVDLANARLEILWAFGIKMMNAFTDHYASAMAELDYAHLPYWDLCAALRPASVISGWGLDAQTENTMRERHKWFVAGALQRL